MKSERASPDRAPSPAQTAVLNRELFERFDEVFFRLLGLSTSEMLKADPHFGTACAKKREGILKWVRSFDDYLQELEDTLDGLRAYLGETNTQRWRGAAALPGAKLVYGGKQSFTGSGEKAVRSMLLYCDTVLIPDPVLPFVETLMMHGRPRENYFLQRLAEQIFYLQKLKPLVVADLPYPAIAIFPSFEKSLEQKDPTTQDGLERQLLDVFSHFTRIPFDDLQELDDLRIGEPDRLVKAISNHGLLLATGQDGFNDAVNWIRESYCERLVGEARGELEAADDLQLAIQYFADQTVPHFHLRENAELLDAAPLLSAEIHWHYFGLLRQVERETLVKYGLVKPDTLDLIEALNTPSMKWLGNVPIELLVELRLDLQNETFRKRLHSQMDELGLVNGENIDRVTAKVSRALRTMLTEHDLDVREITDKYGKKYAQTAVASWITVGAAFSAIFPLGLPVAVALASKYAVDKVGELIDRRDNRKSLFGVLAAAHDSEG